MVAVGTDANPLDDPADAAALAGHAAALVDAIAVALPGWAEHTVLGRWQAWSGEEPTAEIVAAAGEAAELIHAEAVPALRTLLATDVDEQRTNPLSILRRATRHVTVALVAVGVPPPPRDEHAARLFPDDVYDLGPATFADLGPSVHEPGLVWGAAKAHVVMARRRADD